MAHDGHKDPETLEREIDQVRAEMSRTLEALERKFSPGQLLDYYLGALREHGGEFAANLGNSVKQNPVPMMLTAIGLTWTMFSTNRPKTGYHDESYTYDQHDGSPGMGEKLKATAEGARERLANSKDAVRDTISSTARNTQDRARRAREGFSSLVEEQPLILGALGIALGAAIGASLPRTEQEDRLIGKARDQTIEKIKQQGAQAYDKAREAGRAAVG
jgi:ElaB/YqjD/DUF883 family membrane-anchored ribosome-binding protein